jgi:cobalt-zinc-cadmium efflux system membrane fusion protein
MKRLIIIPLCFAALCACGSRSGADNTDNKLLVTEGEHIIVADDSPLLQAIRIKQAEVAEYRATFTASGVVQPVSSQYAEIASPFAGRIVKSFVRLGQKVSAGSPVFEISSPAFSEAGKACYQAKQEMDLALKTLNRERDLLANHVGAAKDTEEAEANYELKKKDYEQALAALNVYRTRPEDAAPGQPLIVRSPIDGEIVKDKIVIGQYIREDAEALAIVADLDKVWVSAHVKEKDLRRMNGVDKVEIRLTAVDEPVSGAIYHVSELLDEETRSAETLIECDNRRRLLKPFMYGAVHFTAKPERMVVVPHSAVLQREANRYVIVSEGKNKFRRASVTLASADNGEQTVIRSGINAGDRIVVQGAYYFIDAQ